LPGVEIGDHAVIGAGAVVHRSIPPWKVAVGVPAKVIKDRRDAVPQTSPRGLRQSEAA
jgi:acetyltransferase-like isoleucine patch superfamily enzyme